MLDGAIDGYEPYEEVIAAQPRHAARRGAGRGPGHALQLRHHRSSEGREGRAAGRAARRGRRRCHHAWRRSSSAPTRTSVYLSPAPLYHAAPLRFCRAVHRLGGTVVVMEHFDPEQYLALVEQHRVTFSQVVPTMFIRMLKLPDEVRARYDLSSLQRGRARGRTLPRRGEGADDRVVRPDHPRVLRRHRGQRLRVLQQRGLARPPRHGRPVDPRHGPHRRRRRRGGAHRRVGHRVLRGRGGVDVRVPQRRREDRRAPATRRAAGGARSATSATSTTTASSTSPTARRT